MGRTLPQIICKIQNITVQGAKKAWSFSRKDSDVLVLWLKLTRYSTACLSEKPSISWSLSETHVLSAIFEEIRKETTENLKICYF